MNGIFNILTQLWIVNAATSTFFHEHSYTELQPTGLKTNGANFGFSMGYQKKTKTLAVGAPYYDLEGKVFTYSMEKIFRNKTAESTGLDIKMAEFAKDFSRNNSVGQNFCLGASIAVTSDYIFTCAPLWTSEMTIIDDTYSGAYGVCFVVNDTHTSRYNGPFEQRLSSNLGFKKRIYTKTFGGVGFSTYVDEEDGLGLMSLSPSANPTDVGFFNASSPLDPVKFMNMFSQKSVYNSIYKHLGAFVSGLFFDPEKTFYAFSARTSDMIGVVGFFEKPCKDNHTCVTSRQGKILRKWGNNMFTPITLEDPYNIGSMFGAALGAADLNSDGLSDLLIGAPAHGTDYYDSGALHIYLGGEAVSMEKRHTVILRNKSGGRFGTALATSDMDGDGIPEIFISAPFEDSGVGALYILDGFEIKNLLKTSGNVIALSELKMTQRIQNKKYNAFGYSLQNLSDLDGNGCNELAVGAPNSDRVIVYHCIPTINVIVSTKLINRDYVKLQDKNFTVNLEIKIDNPQNLTGFNTSLTTTMKVIGNGITISEEDHFENTVTDNTGTIAKNITLMLSNEEPGTYMLEATVKSDINQYLRSDVFSRSRVRISSHNPATAQLKVERRCPADIDCDPKLLSEILWSGTDPYILGSTRNETLTISILNEGFSAYQSCARIRIIGSQPVLNCTIEENNCYRCMIPQLTRKSTHSIDIQLDMTKQISLDKQMEISVSLQNTCNLESVPKVVKRIIPFVLDTAGVSVKGLPHVRQVTDSAVKNEEITTIVDDHEFTVINDGFVTWKSVNATVKVVKRSYITEYNITSIQANCTEDDGNDLIYNIFNCNFDLQRESALKIKVTFEIAKDMCVSDLVKGELELSTIFELYLESNANITKELTTTFLYIQDESLGQNKLLIIFLAVVVSIIILAIIILVLYKMKFFKREVKDKLTEMKHEIRKQSIKKPDPVELQEILKPRLSTLQERIEQREDELHSSSESIVIEETCDRASILEDNSRKGSKRVKSKS